MQDLQQEVPTSPHSSQKSKTKEFDDDQADTVVQEEPNNASSEENHSADSSPKANRGVSDEDEDSTSEANETFAEKEDPPKDDTTMQGNDNNNDQPQQIPHQIDNPEVAQAQMSIPMVTEDTLPSLEEMELLKKTKPLEYIKLFKARKESLAQSIFPSPTTTSSGTSSGETNEALLQKIKEKVFGVDLFALVKANATAGVSLRKLINRIDLVNAPYNS